MGGDRATDGTRIAELLASELTGLERGPLASVAITDADPDAEPSTEGTPAYRVTFEDEVVAEAFLHPDRVRLEIRVDPAAAAEAVHGPDLRARPKATDPPRTLLFVESGAAVKRAADALAAALESELSEE